MPKTSIVVEGGVVLSMHQAWATAVRFSVTSGSKDSVLRVDFVGLDKGREGWGVGYYE